MQRQLIALTAACGVLFLAAFSVLAHLAWQGPPRNDVLTAENYRQKFDQIEQTQQQRPGTLAPAAVEAILGPGQIVQSSHPDLAGPAFAGTNEVSRWTRWEYLHETLIVGYTAGGAAESVSLTVRLRR